MRTSRLLAAMAAMVLLVPAMADARVGGGTNSGSRGSKTDQAPAPTQTAPATKPVERSATPTQQAQARPAATPAAAPGGFFARNPFLSGMMGGMLGAGLIGMMFGGGFGGWVARRCSRHARPAGPARADRRPRLSRLSPVEGPVGRSGSREPGLCRRTAADGRADVDGTQHACGRGWWRRRCRCCRSGGHRHRAGGFQHLREDAVRHPVGLQQGRPHQAQDDGDARDGRLLLRAALRQCQPRRREQGRRGQARAGRPVRSRGAKAASTMPASRCASA